jgi:hypothetical protein
MRRLLPVVLLLLAPSPATTDEDTPVCTESERNDYFDSIQRRIYDNWRVPYRNENLGCTVLIKQDWRGEVRDVGIARCTDDPVMHRSVVNAAYRSSPMPLPKNKACFTESVIVRIEARTQSYD